jgi:CNT family concentrative nucleoside transporter
MAGGFATIAGGVLAAYVGFLGGDDPAEREAFAKFLLCASLMNAPAALVMAKLMVPQTGQADSVLPAAAADRRANLLDALAEGTTAGLKLALNVAAMLLVFLAFIAMLNWLLAEGLGGLRFGAGGPFAGADGHLNQLVARLTGGTYRELSLESLAGLAGAPFAWLVGVGSGDVLEVGQLIGKRLVTNEFVAYTDLASLRGAGVLSERSVFLATFALCGFANFGSIGIQLGGIGGMAPGQRPVIASLALRALAAGTLASLLSACIAGMFYR